MTAPPHAPELRLYAGVHAGARARLSCGSYCVGSGADCDFILCDDGVRERHATLQIAEGAWTLALLPDGNGIGDGRDISLRAGLGVAVGRALLAVEPADAPWSEPAARALVQTADSPSENPGDPSLAAPVQPDPSPEAGLADGDHGPARPGGAAPPLRVPQRVRAYRNGLRAGLLGLAGAALLVGVAWFRAGGDTAPAAQRATTGGAQSSTLQRVQDAVSGLSGLEHLHVEARSDGQTVVRGRLLRADHEALSEVLLRHKLRPLLHVTVLEDLDAALQDLLLREGARVRAQALGGARFLLHGELDSEGELDALLRVVEQEFAGSVHIDSAVETPQRVASRVLAELRDGQARQVRGDWQGSRFVVRAGIARADEAAWLGWMEPLVRRHGTWLDLSLQVQDAVATASHRGSAPALDIRGVVGGATPYIVLTDQTKLLEGSRWKGWLLRRIEPDSVVFEGTHSVVIPR